MGLQELMTTILDQGPFDGTGPEPCVPLELFFDGNDELGSIGCNLSEHPGTARFHEVLVAIRGRPEVTDVVVGITEIMPEGEWPFSDHVYVIASALPEHVALWAQDLFPDHAIVGFWSSDGPPRRFPDVPAGQHVVMLWWD